MMSGPLPADFSYTPLPMRRYWVKPACSTSLVLGDCECLPVMLGAEMTRRVGWPQYGHFFMGGSLIFCNMATGRLQKSQPAPGLVLTYSNKGMRPVYRSPGSRARRRNPNLRQSRLNQAAESDNR